MMLVPDHKEDHITGEENDEDVGEEKNVNKVAGVNKKTENVRRSRVRLRNSRYYNHGMINTTISDEDLPKLQECTKPRNAMEEDVMASTFEYALTQYGLVKGLQKYGSKEKRQQKKS